MDYLKKHPFLLDVIVRENITGASSVDYSVNFKRLLTESEFDSMENCNSDSDEALRYANKKKDILTFLSYVSDKKLRYKLTSYEYPHMTKIEEAIEYLKNNSLDDFYDSLFEIKIFHSNELNEVLDEAFGEVKVNCSYGGNNIKVNYERVYEEDAFVLNDVTFNTRKNNCDLDVFENTLNEIGDEIKKRFNTRIYLFIGKSESHLTSKLNVNIYHSQSNNDYFDYLDDYSDTLLYNEKNKKLLNEIIDELIKPKFKKVRFSYEIHRIEDGYFSFENMHLGIIP